MSYLAPTLYTVRTELYMRKKQKKPRGCVSLKLKWKSTETASVADPELLPGSRSKIIVPDPDPAKNEIVDKN